jgi:hypothetical protein
MTSNVQLTKDFFRPRLALASDLVTHRARNSSDIMCCDWTTWGECETAEPTAADIRHALLKHNPRRALQRPIMLSSNNRGVGDFFLPRVGLASTMQEQGRTEMDAGEESAHCTDFTLWGAVASDSILDVRNALLPKDSGDKRPIQLTSCNSGCEHFVVDGVSSAPWTSDDVQWMENVHELAPGT